MKTIKLDTNIRLIRHWGRWYITYSPYNEWIKVTSRTKSTYNK